MTAQKLGCDMQVGDVLTPSRFLRQRRRRPHPWTRFSTAQVDEMLAALRDEITRQVAARRALQDSVAAWLAGRGDAYREDAAHVARHGGKGKFTAEQYRALADELHACVRDFEEEITRVE